jgi:hypothetical protein
MLSKLSSKERKSKGWLSNRQKGGAKPKLRSSEVNRLRKRKLRRKDRLSNNGNNSYSLEGLSKRRSKPGSSVKGHLSAEEKTKTSNGKT